LNYTKDTLDRSLPGMALFKIVSRLNGLAMDITGGNTQPGTKVVVWENHGRDNQQWYDDPATGTIRTKLNGFCLDIEGDQRLRIMPYQPGDPNQQWERDPQGYIRNRVNRNKVLDIAQGNKNPGAEIIMWDQNGAPNQLWNFEFVGGSAPQQAYGAYPAQQNYPGQYPGQYPAPGQYPPAPGQYPSSGQYPPATGQYPGQGYPGYPAQTAASTQRREFLIVSPFADGKVLDIKGGQGNRGDDIILWGRNQGKNQRWYLDQQGFIRSALNDYAINAAAGQKAEVEPFNGGPNQQWVTEGNRVVNRANGECLDIYSAHKHDGATVGSWRWKDSPNQQWRIEYV